MDLVKPTFTVQKMTIESVGSTIKNREGYIV